MYDYLINGEKIYMLLEYATGGDMLTYIQKLNSRIPEKDCKLWMKQLCNAVQYLHLKNIIHRDLKLENLLIDTNKNLKLCDFGFCKDVSKGSDELSKTYCGSKAYASPGLYYQSFYLIIYSYFINYRFLIEILLGQPYDPKKGKKGFIDLFLLGFFNSLI